ncbi:methyltransferase [Bacillus sp. EB106-08-02-XG196]|jgi:SAM-dependent methyltransferase|uniref:methyltransferase n=1 Tax=Bacillus sp. EB106-08-02-XG196 TaxID=2737049 RepID=UPI0015C435DD|nr:methyltransferase [Bacillus sp. EB106-08-02-XG196]NWQ44403.1 methyltransferase [Bacillus sp. EB106-08-02-XG196]
MKETNYDELLNIETEGNQRGYNKSFHYHRYEPTPYTALENLFAEYELNSSDHIVDFGCGKGRLNFFIHYLFHSSVTGVEMNEKLYEEAIENKENYLIKAKNKGEIQFQCCLAEKYEINPLDNTFYFFNPFTIPIFWKIINNILVSVEKFKREVDVILYYPSEDYIYYLENHTSFELIKEIQLPGIYENNANERFLIYRLAY